METFERNGYKVTIEQDQDAMSPEENQDKHAFIATTRNRYFEVTGPNGETASDIGDNLEQWEETHHVYKLNALIHSGVHLSITSDLKQLGIIYFTPLTVLRESSIFNALEDSR